MLRVKFVNSEISTTFYTAIYVPLQFVFMLAFFFFFLYPPYPKDRGMLWFYVEAARRPPPAARNGVNAITQKPLDGLFSNLVYTLVVIVSWPD